MEEKDVLLSDVVYPEIYSTQKLSFTGDNFLIWKLKLAFILTDRKLNHLLDPPPPSESTQTPADTESSVGFILQTLDDSLQREYMYHSTGESVLRGIFTRFGSLLSSSKMYKLRLYKAHRMEAGAHINQHIFRMRAMAKELQYAGVELPDKFQALILLNSLPADWEEDVAGLLREMDLGEDEFTWDVVCRRLRILRDVKKWREFRRGKNKFKGNCYSCGEQGHYQSNCPQQAADKQKGPFFQYRDGTTLLELLYCRFNSILKLKYNLAFYYDTWKTALFDVLEHSDVDYVLRDPMPMEHINLTPEDGMQQLKKWQADDFTCRHLILGTMDDDLFLSFHDYPTAKALLEAIESCFNYSSPARKLYMLQKYLGHCMMEDTKIISHNIKMDVMALKLQTCGIKVPEEMQSVILLDSLPNTWESYLQTLNVDICIKDDLSINTVRGKVKDMGMLRELFAEQRAGRQSHHSSNSKGSEDRRRICYSCGRPGHLRANCPDT